MMAATPPIHLPDLANMNQIHLVPQTPAQQEQLGARAVSEADDRSSSLSEIEERGVTERLNPALFANGSDMGDTEAETERLEDSPQKTRSQQNVVLVAGTPALNEPGEQAAEFNVVSNGQTYDDAMEIERMAQTSDISSLGNTSDDPHLTPSDSSRKRKRIMYTPRPQPSVEDSRVDSGHTANYQANGTREQYQSSSPEVSNCGLRFAQEQGSPQNEEDLSENGTSARVPREKAKGKRKGKRLDATPPDRLSETRADINVPTEPVRSVEPVYSNGEDAIAEDPTGGTGIGTNVKSEEGLGKKKSALDALTAIEDCFASLREKLYDERIAHCDAELAMLNSTAPTHPEFLAALEVIDRHRDEKIRYEDTLLKYKLQALERKSIAEKHQAHSQFMLRAGNIREEHLADLNRQIYQVQHERRAVENTAEEYMYHYQPKRSDQIRRQAAYNKEVSLLSGIAKHVGFPAAPEIKGLKPNEIADDLRAMGINYQPAPVAPAQPTIPRPSLPLSASFTKQNSSTNERFLEQNPWANPQHPAHGHLQRQRSGLSRPQSPLVTPAQQKRVVDLTGGQGSASTIAEPLSRQNSATAPTPATGEERLAVPKSRHSLNANNNNNNAYSTPIKAPDHPQSKRSTPNPIPKEPTNETTKPASTLKQPRSSSLHRNPSPKPPIHGSSLANPLPIPDGPVLSSPIPHFTPVKVEDRPPHSLLGHNVPGALSVSTVPNGTNRFGGVL